MKKIVPLILIAALSFACGSTKNTTKKEAVAKTTGPSFVGVGKKIEKPETPEIPETREVPKIEVVTPEVPPVTIDETKEIITEKVIVEEPEAEIATPAATDAVHSSFNKLLKDYVSPQGNVNYQGFKNNRSALNAYITALGENLPADNWSKEEKLAYWMNAYNAMTIDLILRNMPVASIKDIKDPWKQRLWKLGSKWYNLDEIEHQILRKMGDARIHFGINCASFSCPPILNEAFTAQKVDNQLDVLARQFVNDTQRNTITASTVTISKIFNWFSKDFKRNGSVVDFLNKYSNVQINKNARVRYMDYNWDLNK